VLTQKDTTMVEYTPSMRQLDLQVAYQISDDLSGRDVGTLYWAKDRLEWGKRFLNEDSSHQRFAAIMRIAKELDRRSVPLRYPFVPNQFDALYGVASADLH